MAGCLSCASLIFSLAVSNVKNPGSEKNRRKVWAAIFKDVIEGVITKISSSAASVGKNTNNFPVTRQ